MRYKRFEINNFKGANKIVLSLDRIPQTNVFSLVGLNESGKTTILEAIHWFYQPDFYNTNDLIPKSELDNFNNVIKVTAHIELSRNDEDNISTFMRKKQKFVIDRPISKLTITRSFKYTN